MAEHADELARRYGITLDQLAVVLSADGRRPFNRFNNHRRRASNRGIEFRLTFWEWWTIWVASGHYHQMGNRRGEYVMARRWDSGPYAEGNVEIQTNAENHATWVLRKRFRAVGCKHERLIDRADFLESVEGYCTSSAV